MLKEAPLWDLDILPVFFFLRITFVEQLYFVLQKIPALCRCRRPRIATWSWFVSWIDLKSAHSMNVKNVHSLWQFSFKSYLPCYLMFYCFCRATDLPTYLAISFIFLQPASQPLCHFIILFEILLISVTIAITNKNLSKYSIKRTSIFMSQLILPPQLLIHPHRVIKLVVHGLYWWFSGALVCPF